MPWEASIFDEVATVQEVTVVVPAPDREPIRVPVWVVAVGGHLYARSWKGETGRWYRRARRYGTGAVATSTGEHPVRFVPIADADLDAAIDRVYLTKYAGTQYARAMIEPPATGTTLRLDPAVTP
jgi:hypothetical protein